jgi:hypothetical protein
MDPGFPVVSVGPCTFFAATLDKVQYDYHPHAPHSRLVTAKNVCYILPTYMDAQKESFDF